MQMHCGDSLFDYVLNAFFINSTAEHILARKCFAGPLFHARDNKKASWLLHLQCSIDQIFYSNLHLFFFFFIKIATFWFIIAPS